MKKPFVYINTYDMMCGGCLSRRYLLDVVIVTAAITESKSNQYI